MFAYTLDDLYGDPESHPDIGRIARRRYAARRRGEAALVLAAVLVIIIGEAASAIALSGSDSVSSAGWLFGITAACLTGTIIVVTLAALRDLVPALGRV